MFKSYTYGELDIQGVADKIKEFHDRTSEWGTEFQITIGTDSQNFADTKVVSVIAVHREGHGGIFFYEVTNIPRIQDVTRKLTEETSRSLTTITELIAVLESSDKYKQVRDDALISIHIDAGWSDKGKTKELIPMLVGWIKACGYDCRVKPDSYAASSIADKISK